MQQHAFVATNSQPEKHTHSYYTTRGVGLWNLKQNIFSAQARHIPLFGCPAWARCRKFLRSGDTFDRINTAKSGTCTQAQQNLSSICHL